MELALKFRESENEECSTTKKHDVSFENKLFLQEQQHFFLLRNLRLLVQICLDLYLTSRKVNLQKKRYFEIENH